MGRAFRWIALAAFIAAGLVAAGHSHAGARPCDPALRIVAPRAGQTVRMPFPIHYRVRCFRIGRAPNGYIELRLAAPGSVSIVLRPGPRAGIAIVPRNPLLSGRRTLLLQLTRADGTPLTNPRATFRLGPLRILGSR